MLQMLQTCNGGLTRFKGCGIVVLTRSVKNMGECELYKMILREKLKALGKENSDFWCEMDTTFLGFENVYKAATLFVPKNKTIIDFGCAYGCQSWYFRDYKRYIGVEYCDVHPLQTKNSTYYTCTPIKKFLEEIFPTLGIDTKDVFAICSYVPDESSVKAVRETFENVLAYYP